MSQVDLNTDLNDEMDIPEPATPMVRERAGPPPKKSLFSFGRKPATDIKSTTPVGNADEKSFWGKRPVDGWDASQEEEYASKPSDAAKTSFGSKLLSRAKSIGQNLANPDLLASAARTLKDPAFLAQMGGSMAIGAGVKATLGAAASIGLSALGTSAAVTIAAPFALAAVGGSAASVLVGQLRDDYNRSQAFRPKASSQGVAANFAAFFDHAGKFGAFSVRSTISGNVFKSIAKQWKNDKSVVMKRAAMGAGFGLLGGALHEIIGDALQNPSAPAPAEATPVAQTAPLSTANPASLAETSAAPIEASPAPALEAPVLSAQEMKDRAVELWNGLNGVEQDKEAALALFRQAAEAGNQQALRDLAQITGETVTAPAVPAPEIPVVVETPAAELTVSVALTVETPALEATAPLLNLETPVEAPVLSGEESGTCYVDPAQIQEAVCQPTKWYMQIGDWFRLKNTATGMETAVQLEAEAGKNVLTQNFMVASVKNSWDMLMDATSPAEAANENLPLTNTELAAVHTATAPAMR